MKKTNNGDFVTVLIMFAHYLETYPDEFNETDIKLCWKFLNDFAEIMNEFVTSNLSSPEITH